MKPITISQEWRLYLTASQGTDGERFAERFRRVWEAIPEQHRIKMRSRWWLVDQPTIGVQFWPLHVFEGLHRYPLACYTLDSEEFRFRATWINKMPDEIVEILIAHELAHCLIIASGGALDVDRWQDEEKVAEVIDSWGLNEYPLNLWIVDNSFLFYCEDCGEEMSGPTNSWEQCRNCLADYLIEPEGDGWMPVKCESKEIIQFMEQRQQS